MIFFSLSPLIVGQLIYNEFSNITRMNGKNYYKIDKYSFLFMAFLNNTGLQTLTNNLIKSENIKVQSTKGANVKQVIDNIERECNTISTPNTIKIENRVNEFKVGQGRDIDVSGDIETGYGEIELQGKT